MHASFITRNMLSGGKQSVNTLDFKQFMIAPLGSTTIAESLRMCSEVYHTMEIMLKDLGRSTCVGYDGGFLPNLASNEEALALIVGATLKTGYTPGKDIAFIIDVEASDFFEAGEYNFPGEGFIKTPRELVEYYARLVADYPILAIQSGMARDDREGNALFIERLSDKMLTHREAAS